MSHARKVTSHFGHENDDIFLLRQKLAKEVQVLSSLRSLKSYLAIVFDWFSIFAVIYLMTIYSHILTFVGGVIFIAGRQHALLVMTHEGVHKLVHRKLWINDLITDLLCAFPLFIRTESYRSHHLKHHRHLNTDDDPDWKRKVINADWHFPQPIKKFLGICGKYLLGMGILDIALFIYAFAPLGRKNRKSKFILRTSYYLMITCAFTYFSLWQDFLLYWLVPFVFVLPLLNRIRSIAEHFALEYKDHLSQSRNVHGSIFDRTLIAPHNVGLHLDHHLFPNIPFYNLPILNAKLTNDDHYRSNAHCNQGYLSMKKESLLGDILSFPGKGKSL